MPAESTPQPVAFSIGGRFSTTHLLDLRREIAATLGISLTQVNWTDDSHLLTVPPVAGREVMLDKLRGCFTAYNSGHRTDLSIA